MPDLTSDWLMVLDHPIATTEEIGRYCAAARRGRRAKTYRFAAKNS